MFKNSKNKNFLSHSLDILSVESYLLFVICYLLFVIWFWIVQLFGPLPFKFVIVWFQMSCLPFLHKSTILNHSLS